MDTILLQIKNDKAYKLIENLEALNIVKVLKKGRSTSNAIKAIPKPSEYAGRISKKTATIMIADLDQSRNEWERSF
ncbi:MAG TPA: hypothetical protein VFI29_15185 [Hanamia sp.]|nr:hypothetical protein [Hanamia sp.]